MFRYVEMEESQVYANVTLLLFLMSHYIHSIYEVLLFYYSQTCKRRRYNNNNIIKFTRE